MKLFVCVLIVVMLAGGAVCVQAYSDIMDIQVIPDVQMITPVVVTAPVKPDPHVAYISSSGRDKRGVITSKTTSVSREGQMSAGALVEHLNDTINRTERTEGWTCVDYSIDFVDNNPEWMVLSISRSYNFCPESHMINCIIYDNETLIVYDALNDNMYRIGGWQWDHIDYYHFWVDGEQIVRNYRRLFDNRGDVI